MSERNDDPMDEMLIQGVRDYNTPGAVPREEMWKRIQAVRNDERRATSGTIADRAQVSPIRRWSVIGIAATLLLTAGIVIGRRMDRTETPVQNVASNPTTAPAAKRDSTRELVNQLQNETRKTGTRVRELASSEPRVPSSEPRVSGNQNLALRLVTLQHLAGAEAMITSFRQTSRNGAVDAQISAWAKELLGTTRLLESSKQIDDPVMKRLLEDLDLVISQIVQYTAHGTMNTEELDLIEQSINKRGVMSKLRSNSSRGITAGT